MVRMIVGGRVGQEEVGAKGPDQTDHLPAGVERRLQFAVDEVHDLVGRPDDATGGQCLPRGGVWPTWAQTRLQRCRRKG